jgi:hypothetical protein
MYEDISELNKEDAVMEEAEKTTQKAYAHIVTFG